MTRASSFHSQGTRPRAGGRFYRRRQGQIMLMSAMFVPVMLAFMGLAIDVGHLYHVKRRMQYAADAGAMGGASEIYRRNALGLVQQMARDDVKINGFDYTDPSIQVEINNPPVSGPRAGDPLFVEVIITQGLPTYFLQSVDANAATIRARAVAGILRAHHVCVIALDPDDRGSLTVQGTSSLYAPCGVAVNSDDTRALIVNGGGCVYAEPTGVSVTGEYVMNGSANCIYPGPSTDSPRIIDPLDYMAPPTVPLPPEAIAVGLEITGGDVTLKPGLYLGAANVDPVTGAVTYTESIRISGGNVTFEPGIYYLSSGMKITGSPTVTGAGVMFYNTNVLGVEDAWKDIDIAGTATVKFSAPDEGYYEGMLIWNDRNAPDRNPGSVIAGTSDSYFLGAIYSPSSALKYVGISVTESWTMLIGNTITISGNGVVPNAYSSTSVQLSTFRPTLVE